MKKNLVVIGYGGIGSTLHVPNAQKSDVVNLLGIYDMTRSNRRRPLTMAFSATPRWKKY